MKKIFTFSLVLLLNSITMVQARTLQEAAQVANDFFAERSVIIASHAQRTAMQLWAGKWKVQRLKCACDWLLDS